MCPRDISTRSGWPRGRGSCGGAGKVGMRRQRLRAIPHLSLDPLDDRPAAPSRRRCLDLKLPFSSVIAWCRSVTGGGWRPRWICLAMRLPLTGRPPTCERSGRGVGMRRGLVPHLYVIARRGARPGRMGCRTGYRWIGCLAADLLDAARLRGDPLMLARHLLVRHLLAPGRRLGVSVRRRRVISRCVVPPARLLRPGGRWVAVTGCGENAGTHPRLGRGVAR